MKGYTSFRYCKRINLVFNVHRITN